MRATKTLCSSFFSSGLMMALEFRSFKSQSVLLIISPTFALPPRFLTSIKSIRQEMEASITLYSVSGSLRSRRRQSMPIYCQSSEDLERNDGLQIRSKDIPLMAKQFRRFRHQHWS